MNTKDRWETTITIHDEVRAAVWGAIFPGARIPVLTIVPVHADLPGMPGASVYFLDLEAISDDQRDGLVHTIADLFGLSLDDVHQDIQKGGVPILADNTSLESSDRTLVQELIADLTGAGPDLDPALVRTLSDGPDLEEADVAGLEEIDPSLAGLDDWNGKELEIDDDGGNDD